jgi:hypothetical protein
LALIRNLAGRLTGSLRFHRVFENQTPIRTGSHCQIASQGWNGPDKQICNWGFQEKSLLKTQALMTTIENVRSADEI